MLDKLLPVFVGNRTEILGLAITVLQLLGVFGVLDRAQADEASKVLGGVGVATLAARVTRVTS